MVALKEQKPKKTVKHRKSRFGCPTCRRRKVKCDETLPECMNCVQLRVVRCGYLDYTPEQINSIKFAHWEVERQLQRENQANNPVVSPQSIDSYSPLSSPQTVDGFTINLIPHLLIGPQLDLSAPVYFNETNNGMIIRYMVMKITHIHLLSTTENDMSFKGILLMGCGVLVSKYPHLEEVYLRTRGVCMKYLLENLTNVDDSNAATLMNLSNMLDTSSVFLKDTLSYKQYFKLAMGPSSILQIAYKDLSKFPKSLQTLKFYADSMLNTTKSVWVPQYDYRMLFELKDVIEEFGQKYILVQQHTNNALKVKYIQLIKFIDKCLDLFQLDRDPCSVLSYPINKVHDLYQDWFTIFPSEAATLDCSNMTSVEKVFYVFWLTLLEELYCIMSSCRYVFSFFFDGFYFSLPFKREDITNTLDRDGDAQLRWFFNYCGRVISFLDRRVVYVMSNTILSEPIPHFLHLKDRLKARPLDIHERCITNFRDTVIKRSHYPTESTALKGFQSSEDVVNFYMSSSHSPTDTSDELRDSQAEHDNQQADYLAGFLENTSFLTNPELQNVDLLNNINPVTSLLYNDYDPRFTDPIFEKKLAYQEADLDFIERYIEDRRLIIQKMEEIEENDSED